MRIHHLIIGTEELQASVQFYTNLLGFSDEGSFIDTANGKEGRILGSPEGLQLLLVPYPPERLPNPRHLAFEVATNQLDAIYQKAKAMGLKIRAESPRDFPHEGIGKLEAGGKSYRNFYVFDPAGANLEILALQVNT